MNSCTNMPLSFKFEYTFIQRNKFIELSDKYYSLFIFIINVFKLKNRLL
jgi:hypothetical protein